MKGLAKLARRPMPAWMVVGVLVASVAGGGIALARSSATFSGCAKDKGGALRLAQACKKNETKVSWNKQGPAGTNGTNGARGPAGTNGTNGTNGANGTNGTNGPPGPITGVLPSGVTLRGTWAVRFESGGTAQSIQTAISFGFTLSAPPVANFIPLGGAVPAGCVGGTPTAPTAQPGNLCVFEEGNSNIAAASEVIFDQTGAEAHADVFGAGLAADQTAANADTRWRGSWAVTAQ